MYQKPGFVRVDVEILDNFAAYTDSASLTTASTAATIGTTTTTTTTTLVCYKKYNPHSQWTDDCHEYIEPALLPYNDMLYNDPNIVDVGAMLPSVCAAYGVDVNH